MTGRRSNGPQRFGSVAAPAGPGINRLMGPSLSSAITVQRTLNANHFQNHIFFNDGLHNHMAHAILASYALGATSETIDAVYNYQQLNLKPMPPLQHVLITDNNWVSYLGKEECYPNFVVFFEERIRTLGAELAIERYVFGSGLKDNGALLVRAVSGALHPLIHIGYGVEFGIDAIVAEGIAQACVHSPQTAGLFPSAWPLNSTQQPSNATSSFISFTQQLQKSLPIPKSKPSFVATLAKLDVTRKRIPRKGLGAFTIIAHMLKDHKLAAGRANHIDDSPKLAHTIQNRWREIVDWCSEWVIDERGGWDEIVEKTEEIFWVATAIVGATSRPGYPARVDFFLMHTLTSALSLPSLLEVLSPSNRIALLYSHFRVMIAYWVSRGRPALYLDSVLLQATDKPSQPNFESQLSGVQAALKDHQDKQTEKSSQPQKEQEGSSDTTPTEETEDPTTPTATHFTPPASSRAASPTPQPSSSPATVWDSLINAAASHPDEHVTKSIRSLAFFAAHLGLTPPGSLSCALSGSSSLDGSIFIRCAGIILSSIGWAIPSSEGKVEYNDWDRSCLGFDEVWQDDNKSIRSTSTHKEDLRVDVDAYTLKRRREKGKTRAVSGETKSGATSPMSAGSSSTEHSLIPPNSAVSVPSVRSSSSHSATSNDEHDYDEVEFDFSKAGSRHDGADDAWRVVGNRPEDEDSPDEDEVEERNLAI